jgi:twitching motility protein PilT
MSLRVINQKTAHIIEQARTLPAAAMERLVAYAAEKEQWIAQVAIDLELMSEQEVAQLMSKACDVPIARLQANHLDPDALAILPEAVCRAFSVIPLTLHNDLLRIAVANPLPEALAELMVYIDQYDVHPVVAPRSVIEAAINAGFRPAPTLQETEARRAMLLPPQARNLAATLAGDNQHLHELHEYLIALVEHNGSDLHLTAGLRPLMRLCDGLQGMPVPELSGEHISEMMHALLTADQWQRFEEYWELDFAYALPGVSRFRVNLFRQSGQVSAIFRAIPAEVPTLAKLGMPAVLHDLALRPRGLVLVTGPTGSGKSTTLAAMVDEINRNRRCHIVTIEDPVEYVHTHKRCEISQRQVGSDTHSFAAALRHVMRQDPDVILIGEMRDLETIATAITAAETGHLVLSTLHTNGAVETIDRIIDVFPPHQQEQIRVQLASVLEGVVSQQLLPSVDNARRVAVQEIMIANMAIRTLIREMKTHQITSIIQSGSRLGMVTMAQNLQRLVQERKITREAASQVMTMASD